MTYKHGDWYCKPVNEAEAKEIIERAISSGAKKDETLSDWSWDAYEAWGVYNGRTFTQKLDFYRYRNFTEYTIEQLREKFPLPIKAVKAYCNGEEVLSVGWHGECSSDKGANWHECIVLPDGFIAYAVTQRDKKLWSTDRIDGLSFRPLHTEREQWIDQVLDVLQKDPCALPSQFIGMIYDAIQSGELKSPEERS